MSRESAEELSEARINYWYATAERLRAEVADLRSQLAGARDALDVLQELVDDLAPAPDSDDE